ncbi:MAG TPA: PHP domain-containing protein [Thermomicrobiales bacterium]|nr:PHP domain-containing protein [Thermomicrobiales bacterium]
MMVTESAQTRATIDLHTHTNASDGLDAPAELVANASQRGISVLGVTDHDTMDGLDAASEAAAQAGITLVPGVELSTTVDRAEVHVLGYFVDSTESDLRARLSDLAASRVRRVERMIVRLHELGYRVDGEAILAQAEEGSIGRPHVARALMEIGAVDSVNDAFERFLKAGRPAYIPRDPFSPEDAVGLLVRYSAIPVLAHPFSTKDIEGTLARLVPAGLKGLETYYAEYSSEQHAQLHAIADGWGLVPTGGSDYHGLGFREGRELGAAPVPQDAWERLSTLYADLAGGA